MDLQLFVATALAGVIYVVTPGPAFFALFSLGAVHGRLAAARFMAGHLVGDALWAGLALAAVLGANWIGGLVFDLLAVVSGAFLIWLGVKAMRASGPRAQMIGVRGHLPAGVVFGVTNPKAYAVSTATFVALLSPVSDRIGWTTAPTLGAGALAGFIAAYGLLAILVGLAPVRRLFARRGHAVRRALGVLFLLFGAKSLTEGVRGLGRRALSST